MAHPLMVTTLSSRVTDNHFYVLQIDARAMLVDPIDAALALEHLKQHDLTLVAVLNTHWHPDHVRGNRAVLDAHPEAKLIGPEREAALIEQHGGCPLDRSVCGGSSIIDQGFALEVIDTPGHTHGHISYITGRHLFSGDTIFSAGAGHCKLGGDAGVFFRTYANVISRLPGDLIVHPGHDYARRNAAFGLSIIPGDDALLARSSALSQEQDASHTPWTTLEEERAFNVFMRFSDRTLQERLEADHARTWNEALAMSESRDEATFRTLRMLRDSW